MIINIPDDQINLEVEKKVADAINKNVRTLVNEKIKEEINCCVKDKSGKSIRWIQNDVDTVMENTINNEIKRFVMEKLRERFGNGFNNALLDRDLFNYAEMLELDKIGMRNKVLKKIESAYGVGVVDASLFLSGCIQEQFTEVVIEKTAEILANDIRMSAQRVKKLAKAISEEINEKTLTFEIEDNT